MLARDMVKVKTRVGEGVKQHSSVKAHGAWSLVERGRKRTLSLIAPAPQTQLSHSFSGTPQKCQEIS